MANIVWMQTGACSGDSMALLCADRPSIENLVEHYGLNFLWHPSLTAEHRFGDVSRRPAQRPGKARHPVHRGQPDDRPQRQRPVRHLEGRAKIDIVRQLAPLATHVVAMGTCAAFGGVHAAGPNPTGAPAAAIPEQPAGRPARCRLADARHGQPVINVAGCPAHPNTMTRLLAMLAENEPIALDTLNRRRPSSPTLVLRLHAQRISRIRHRG